MRRPTIKTLAGIAAALALTGSASAYFSASGSGDGTGDANVVMQNVTLTAATPATKLYPGASAAVAATIANGNGSRAHVNSLVLDTANNGGFDVDAGHTGCDPDLHLAFSPQNAGWTIPANGSASVTLPGAVTLSDAAPNACQGATFTIYLKAGN